MRHQIAILALLGLLAGCSDSDAPSGETSGQDTAGTAESSAPQAVETAEPAEPKAQTQPEQAANVVLYECNDGSKFEAEVVDQGIMMVINDMSYDLRQQPAASGTLYADDTTSFHVHGEDALLTNEQGTVECQEVAPPKVGAPGIPEPPELSGETVQGD